MSDKPDRTNNPINKKDVRRIALMCGFKYKLQPNGGMDLNPYVFEFVSELEKHRLESLTKSPRHTFNRVFYGNLALFLSVPLVLFILDAIFDQQTSITHALIMSFFLVWNTNKTNSRVRQSDE